MKPHLKKYRIDLKMVKEILCINLNYSNSSCTDYSNSKEINEIIIFSCFGCAGTLLPEGLIRPNHWHPEKLEDWFKRDTTYKAWTAARYAGNKPPWVAKEDWKGWDLPQ